MEILAYALLILWLPMMWKAVKKYGVLVAAGIFFTWVGIYLVIMNSEYLPQPKRAFGTAAFFVIFGLLNRFGLLGISPGFPFYLKTSEDGWVDLSGWTRMSVLKSMISPDKSISLDYSEKHEGWYLSDDPGNYHYSERYGEYSVHMFKH